MLGFDLNNPASLQVHLFEVRFFSEISKILELLALEGFLLCTKSEIREITIFTLLKLLKSSLVRSPVLSNNTWIESYNSPAYSHAFVIQILFNIMGAGWLLKWSHRVTLKKKNRQVNKENSSNWFSISSQVAHLVLSLKEDHRLESKLHNKDWGRVKNVQQIAIKLTIIF